MNVKRTILSGTSLAADVESSDDTSKTFISIGGYIKYNGRELSIPEFRKMKYGIIDEQYVYYFYKYYAVPTRLLLPDMDIHPDELLFYKTEFNISSFEELEKKITVLGAKLDDFVVIWQSKAPL